MGLCPVTQKLTARGVGCSVALRSVTDVRVVRGAPGWSGWPSVIRPPPHPSRASQLMLVLLTLQRHGVLVAGDVNSISPDASKTRYGKQNHEGGCYHMYPKQMPLIWRQALHASRIYASFLQQTAVTVSLHFVPRHVLARTNISLFRLPVLRFWFS